MSKDKGLRQPDLALHTGEPKRLAASKPYRCCVPHWYLDQEPHRNGCRYALVRISPCEGLACGTASRSERFSRGSLCRPDGQPLPLCSSRSAQIALTHYPVCSWLILIYCSHHWGDRPR